MRFLKDKGFSSLLLKNIPFLIVFLLFFQFCNNSDKDNLFSGDYILKSQNVTVQLSLNQKSAGIIEGDLTSSNGTGFHLVGMIKDSSNLAEGECKGNNINLFFEAKIKEDKLILTLINPDKNNKPNYNSSKILVFKSTKKRDTNSINDLNQFSGAGNLSDKSVTDPNWGFRIYIPKGWKYQKTGSGLILGHDRIAGAIIISPHMLSNINKVRDNLLQGISDNTTKLSISGNLSNLSSNILAGDYNGVMNGNRVKAKGLGTLSPYGGGVFIIALTTPENFSNELVSSAYTLAKGIKYKKTNNSNLIQHFAGRWKTNTRNTETSAVLYADGRFVMQYESSYSGNQGSWGVANNDNNRGKWTVRGNKRQGVLILTYANGNQESINYQVHVERGKTYWTEYYFDGTLYWKY